MVALLTVAVAAAVGATTVTYHMAQPDEAMFGGAKTRISLDPRRLADDLALIEAQTGAAEVIGHRYALVPGGGVVRAGSRLESLAGHRITLTHSPWSRPWGVQPRPGHSRRRGSTRRVRRAVDRSHRRNTRPGRRGTGHRLRVRAGRPSNPHSDLSRVPVTQLTVVVLGIPAVAAVSGWRLSGKVPSALARAVLE